MPYIAKQGDLDGLCGVYSICNAVALLWPDEMEDADNRAGLFAELMSYLGNHGIDPVNGTVSADMRGMLAVAAAAISRQFPGKLTVRQPWRSKRAGGVAEWLQALAGTLQSKDASVAILGMWRPSHWTVVRSVSEERLHFADSSSIPDHVPVTEFGMFRSKAEYVLAPKYTFLLTRE